MSNALPYTCEHCGHKGDTAGSFVIETWPLRTRCKGCGQVTKVPDPAPPVFADADAAFEHCRAAGLDYDGFEWGESRAHPSGRPLRIVHRGPRFLRAEWADAT